MLNRFTGMGRLTKDPELLKTQSGLSVATFTIAVDRDYDRNKTDFIQCVAWRNVADFVSKYFTKGQLVVVDGMLQSSDYLDKNGNKRVRWEILIERTYFADRKKTETDVVADDFADDGECPF